MKTEKHWRAVADGVLSIIAGFLHLIGWLAVRAVLTRLIGAGYFGTDEPFLSTTNVTFLVVPLLVLAAVAIVGGIFAVLRRFWGLALAGAICAVFSPGSWMVGVAATVLISISRHEFCREVGESSS